MKDSAAPIEGAIQARRLCKSYGGKVVLSEVDVVVQRGQVHGLLGPNGSGKSTLMGILAGLREADEGTALMSGHIPTKDRDWMRQHVHVQPQKADLFSHLTVAETMALWRSIRGATADDLTRLMSELGLEPHRDQQVRQLSGGQHRRLLVATTLLGSPEIALLDEPTAGVDPHACDAVWEQIHVAAEAGSAVLVSTHGMEDAQQNCHEVTMLDSGRVVAMGAADDLVRKHFDTSVLVLRCDEEYAAAARQQCPEVSFEPDGNDDYRAMVAQPTVVLEQLAGSLGLPEEVTITKPGLAELFRSLTHGDAALEEAEVTA